jgi:uncharacterized membrane protein (UPF0182 family)
MILTPYVPVSPSNKQQNLTAFLTASSDPNDYGTLRLYTTPPNQTIDGPALIGNAIKSNTQISYELSLLNQQSSTVELGQVEVIPIDQTLLYIQPIYVESTANQVPTLKDVVVVYNGTAYNSGNASLDAALCKIQNPDGTKPFTSYCNTSNAQNPSTVPTVGSSPAGGSTTTTTTTTVPNSGGSSTTVSPPPAGATVAALLAQAQADFAAASQALKSGDLAGYQADIAKAEAAVAQAQKLQGANAPTPTGTTTTTTKPTTTTTVPRTTTTTRH